MSKIIKVESFKTMYFKDWDESRKSFENRTDLKEVEEINYTVAKGYCVKFKQISYQIWDNVNNKWVVLPNPTQPKIEGISFNESDEGANNNE